MRSDDIVARGVRGLGMLTLIAAWGVFVLLLGWQLFIYLKDGVWVPAGTLTCLGDLTSWGWTRSPQSWFGLHEVLEFFNFGVACAVVGSVIGTKLIRFESH